MSDDAKLRTAAGMSALWDGEPIKRVRATDGTVVLPGRRVAMHLMAQPDVAAIWLSDPLLIDQGLMSRVLVTAPEPASGRRLWHEPSPESQRNSEAALPLALAEVARGNLSSFVVPSEVARRALDQGQLSRGCSAPTLHFP